VTTNYSTTPGTSPFVLFIFEKLFDTVRLDGFEVLDHAHPEICSVALVDMAKPFTGEIIAFVTIFYVAIQEQRTSLFKEGTLFISWSAPATIRHSNALAFYIILISKVSTADCAVHPTRSD